MQGRKGLLMKRMTAQLLISTAVLVPAAADDGIYQEGLPHRAHKGAANTDMMVHVEPL